MEDDIAIQYDRINLIDKWFIFKPLGVIRGKYNESNNLFITDYGSMYDEISVPYFESDGYFGFPVKLSELKTKFKSNSISELLMDYYVIFTENLVMGYYNFEKGNIDIYKIPFESLNKDSELKLKNCNNLNNYDKFQNADYNVKNCINIPDENNKLFLDNKYKIKKDESKKFTLTDLRKDVFSRIIDQDKAVCDITRTIMINQTSDNPNHKSHILLLGPTGTGKTRIIDIIAKDLDLPYFKADATAYTKEGYIGKSIYSMFNGLILAAGNDIKKAEKGIIIIDEIDKKLSTRDDDVGGVDVLYSLLKVMDRDVIELNSTDNETGSKILFNTSNLTFIVMGAFERLYNKKEESKRQIGFESNITVKNDSICLSRQELIDYGVPSEFLGRIGVISNTNYLSEESLVKILIDSKESPLKEEQEYFKKFGVNIKFSKGFIQKIAHKAYLTRTGARSLRTEVKDVLSDVYDRILSSEKMGNVKITAETITDHKKYYIK